jgi:hypothetical protein
MVIQAARDAAFGAKLFYNGIMWSVIAMFVIYDNDLQKAMFRLNIAYVLGFFGLFGLSYYLFNTCGLNPGFVEANNNNRELTGLKSDSFEGNETLLQSQGSTNAINIDMEAGPVSLSENENTETVRRVTSPKKSSNNFDNGMRFCEPCQIYQPYRSKHCKQCEKCVHKFDHHCFWIGGCVGELNHRKFWLFLFFQTVLEVWAYLIADSGLDASYAKGQQLVKDGAKGTSSPYQTSEYGAFTVATMAVLLAALFTGILLGFHTFLILTNQSTWEYSKKDQLSYLKNYPRSFYPFSAGFIGNVKLIFFHGNVPTEWELPPVQVSRKKKGFNWCENEYWSCC